MVVEHKTSPPKEKKTPKKPQDITVSNLCYLERHLPATFEILENMQKWGFQWKQIRIDGGGTWVSNRKKNPKEKGGRRFPGESHASAIQHQREEEDIKDDYVLRGRLLNSFGLLFFFFFICKDFSFSLNNNLSQPSTGREIEWISDFNDDKNHHRAMEGEILCW